MGMRNRIFISYSHKDEEFLEAWREYLVFWERHHALDVWSDQRIAASENWEAEIRAAMDSAAVAVLLVSPTALTSDYIMVKEVPVLVEAAEAGHIAFTCLHARLCEFSKVKIRLKGKAPPVPLSKYQGLNPPDRPINAIEHPHERDTVYCTAARAVATLARAHGGLPERTEQKNTEHQTLVVELQVIEDKLIRRYRFPGAASPMERATPWERFQRYIDDWYKRRPTEERVQTFGGRLFDLLLGPANGSLYSVVLGRLSHSAPDAIPSPVGIRLRVRIRTDIPELARLPWQRTQWQDQVLTGGGIGWTFELMAPGEQRESLTIERPTHVLMIHPARAVVSESEHSACRGHLRDIEIMLRKRWPDFPAPIHEATSKLEVQSGLQARRPEVIYYLGPMSEVDGTPALLLEDPDKPIPITDLPDLWRGTEPKSLYLNLLGKTSKPYGRYAELGLPIVIAAEHSTEDLDDATAEAMRWLSAVADGLDPVSPAMSALTTTVWTAYDTWHPAGAPVVDPLIRARLLLDRLTARGRLTDHVHDLIHGGERRVLAVLAHADVGNRLEHFAEQAVAHLRDKKSTELVIELLPIEINALPKGIEAMEDALRYELNVESFQPIASRLDSLAPAPVEDGRVRVLFLDWRPAWLDAPADTKAATPWLEIWLRFACEKLPDHAPTGVKVISYTGLPLSAAAEDGLQKAIRQIQKSHRHLQTNPRFRHVVLPRLGTVPLEDLESFLADALAADLSAGSPQSPLPIDLEDPQVLLPTDLADLIFEATEDGHYEQVEARVLEGIREGWHRLYHRLSSAVGKP